MGWRDVLKQKQPSPIREISEIPEIWEAGTGNISDISHISATEEGSASLASIAEDCSEFYEERAAIMEYDGGLSREGAEAAAREATEKHRRECFERLEKAANAILSLPTRAMQNRELAKYCAGKGAAACAEMRGWIACRSRGDGLSTLEQSRNVPRGCVTDKVNQLFRD